MDPMVIASLISAAASIGTSIFEKWPGSSKNVDEKLDQIIKGIMKAFVTT